MFCVLDFLIMKLTIYPDIMKLKICFCTREVETYMFLFVTNLLKLFSTHTRARTRTVFRITVCLVSAFHICVTTFPVLCCQIRNYFRSEGSCLAVPPVHSVHQIVFVKIHTVVCANCVLVGPPVSSLGPKLVLKVNGKTFRTM